MNVLSLFDGISCARVALDRAGIPVKTYFASEVDKHAIKVSSTKYPDIVQLGDVRTVAIDGLPPIDLLIGGSPCQDLSIAKKDRQGLAGNRSGLFWEYVRIWKAVQPKWFVLENVASMPKADRDTITQTFGVEPVMFNASLVSAQSRKRLFWTNIKFDLPPDRGILLKDILQPDAEVDESMVVNGKSFCLTASYHKGGEGQWEYEHNKARKQRTMVKLGHIGTEDAQANRVYSTEGKSATLSANGGGLGAKTGLVWIPSPYPVHIPAGESVAPIRAGHEMRRKLKHGKRADDDPTVDAVRRIETRNDDKCGPLTTILKDNPIVDLTSRQQTNLRSVEDKAHCLTSTNYKGSQANGTTLVEQSARIRKLTPIECERLQGLPDNYTDTISKTQRYKCLGNGFNVDVVAHILSAVKTNGGSVF